MYVFKNKFLLNMFKYVKYEVIKCLINNNKVRYNNSIFCLIRTLQAPRAPIRLLYVEHLYCDAIFVWNKSQKTGIAHCKIFTVTSKGKTSVVKIFFSILRALHPILRNYLSWNIQTIGFLILMIINIIYCLTNRP